MRFQFGNGDTVTAINNDEGKKGGAWKIQCVDTSTGGHVATKAPEDQFAMSMALHNRVKQAFTRIDVDKSGTITTGGAYAALSQIFPASTLPNAEQLLNKESFVAAGKDKVVDMDEFLCVATKLFNIQKVYLEFKRYDHNKDGHLERQDLETALMDYYFRDVAQNPRLIIQVAMKAKVKSLVDAIIKEHDTNNDSKVEFQEFETDAFKEEHYTAGAVCESSKSPISDHDQQILYGMLKKYISKGAKKPILTGSQWYQIVSQITEAGIDAMNGNAPAPPLGCMGTNAYQGPKHKFGENNGIKGHKTTNGRRLLDGVVSKGTDNTPKVVMAGQKEKMTRMNALYALHQNADDNKDGEISFTEALDVFQDIHDTLSTDDWKYVVDYCKAAPGPVNCKALTSCGACTSTKNAGLCGWIPEYQQVMPFMLRGKTQDQKPQQSSGRCTFVDRTESNSVNNKDTVRPQTCYHMCPSCSVAKLRTK